MKEPGWKLWCLFEFQAQEVRRHCHVVVATHGKGGKSLLCMHRPAALHIVARPPLQHVVVAADAAAAAGSVNTVGLLWLLLLLLLFHHCCHELVHVLA